MIRYCKRRDDNCDRLKEGNVVGKLRHEMNERTGEKGMTRRNVYSGSDFKSSDAKRPIK
jgi:hypothetical protein